MEFDVYVVGVAIRQRARFRRLRAATRAIRERKVLQALGSTRRSSLRGIWRAWTLATLRHLHLERQREIKQREATQVQLQEQSSLLAASQAEARRSRVSSTLLGEDELPQMLQTLREAALSASAAAEASDGSDLLAVQSTSAIWEGTQLHLCVAALDSLKRQLAKERAATSSARDEAKQCDATAERALAMLQQVRGESSELQQRLTSLEAQGLRAQEMLHEQESALFESRRAHRATASRMAGALAQLEEGCTRQLRKIEARCERQNEKARRFYDKVTAAVERNRDRALDAAVAGAAM